MDIFLYETSQPTQTQLKAFFFALPFYMEYETIFDKKELYNDISLQITNAGKFMFDKEKRLYVTACDENRSDEKVFDLFQSGLHLISLIDAFSKSDEEAFEHFKTVESHFKEALSGILKNYIEDSAQFLDNDVKLMIAYAIFKGCRLGALLKEKYFHIGEEIMKEIENGNPFDVNMTKSLNFAGLYMMALGELTGIMKEENS